MPKQDILEKLARAVVDGDDDNAVAAAGKAIEAGIDATEAIIDGFSKGMNKVGDLFESQLYFLPEVLLSASAFQAGVEVLKPHIKAGSESPGVVVIGTAQGDTHDIGKNLVALMLDVAGYDVHDVGRDVPAEVFINKVRETKADILGLSALMTTSMASMRSVVELLKKEGLRDKVKVLIGGAPVSPRFAQDIEADAYATNAVEAVRVADALLSKSEALATGVS